MYDDVTLHFELPNPDDEGEAAILLSTAFAEWDGRTTRSGSTDRLYKHLRINYRLGEHRGRIKGSLHSFAQGNNAGVFSAADVGRACEDLAASLGLPGSAFKVIELEVGVNLRLNESPMPFLETLVAHKGTSFSSVVPRKGTVQRLQWEAPHTEYSVKCYDKAKYAAQMGDRLPGDPQLFRYEVKFYGSKKLRRLTGLPVLTLADLPRPDIMAVFAGQLTSCWNEIERRQMQTPDFTTPSDLALFMAGEDPLFWSRLKAKGTPKSTLAACRKRYRQLRAEADALRGSDPYDEQVAAQIAALVAPVA